MAKKNQQRVVTRLELAIRTGGLRNAIRAMQYPDVWAIAREALGHDPSAEEVAAGWKASVRVSYRDQAALPTCFPDLDTPAHMYESPEARGQARQQVEAGEEITDAVASLKKPRLSHPRHRPPTSAICHLTPHGTTQ